MNANDVKFWDTSSATISSQFALSVKMDSIIHLKLSNVKVEWTMTAIFAEMDLANFVFRLEIN